MLSRLGSGPVFDHSDPFRAAPLVKKTRDRAAFLRSHLELLEWATKGTHMWMPAFNYDFPRTKIFNIEHDPAQLGPIPEEFRTSGSEWRTPIPIFSVTGTGENPGIEWGERTDPFGDKSLFAKLIEREGVILYYGDTFHYNTIVHYAERKAGGPVYRYDKIFPGTVIYSDDRRVDGSLNYHVRPLGSGLDYDWPRIHKRALDTGACVQSIDYPQIFAARAETLVDFFVDEMNDDPLALLNDETREWVEPALDRLGRRFELADFESPADANAHSNSCER
jgi:aminoglycoside 3-N-acetyltransferase